jgi:hypothetical protein
MQKKVLVAVSGGVDLAEAYPGDSLLDGGWIKEKIE